MECAILSAYQRRIRICRANGPWAIQQRLNFCVPHRQGSAEVGGRAHWKKSVIAIFSITGTVEVDLQRPGNGPVRLNDAVKNRSAPFEYIGHSEYFGSTPPMKSR
jgi:hypothetical protein